MPRSLVLFLSLFLFVNLAIYSAEITQPILLNIVVEDGSFGGRIESVAVNNKSIALQEIPPRGGSFSRRADVSLTVQPGKYTITWITSKSHFGRNDGLKQVNERVLYIRRTDQIVQIYIKGNDIRLYNRYEGYFPS